MKAPEKLPHLAWAARSKPGAFTDERDPRGLPVVAADGREVGAVDDLIVDTDTQRARYLVFNLDANEDGARERVLLPLGHTRLTREGRVRLERCTSEEVEELPRFGGSLDDGPAGVWTSYGTEPPDDAWR